MSTYRTIEMNKHFNIEYRLSEGVKYRALVYKVDNTTKYLRPLSNTTDESFLAHALKMIGWA